MSAYIFYLYVTNTVYKLDFWDGTEWQQWSVQNFDYEATKQNPGISRLVAHNDLNKDLATLIMALDKNSRKAQRLKQIKLALKSTLMLVRMVKNAKLNDEQFIAKKAMVVAKEKLAAATLIKIAKDIKSQAIKKRTYEEITVDEDRDTDDEDHDTDENEEDGYDEENDDMTKKGNKRKDDEQEKFIGQIQKNIVNSNNDARHELFKWAFKLHKNEDYTPSEDVIDEILLREGSNLDHLNRLSVSILQNWTDKDEILSEILSVSLSGIVDLAHDWMSEYCKSVFPDARWSELEKLSYSIYNLTQESDEIYTNVMRVNIKE
ncbi:hypothetical protein G6F35_010652 [Rhizopus arrhizus]|nr:hypothetical protein G6F23_012021 [Rhizopus arrhizus]KAG1209908.1 hypothetical protein G6F35_010652 [Rhizopus arrhizus]